VPKIEANAGVVTHINVFTVALDKQQALVESLTETVEAARAVPGWISASIHRSFDGRQVVNYVQFESHEAADAVTRHLMGLGLIQRNVALGHIVPGQYEVVHSIGGEDVTAR
jgi:quinol monooxygenase YgiN